MVQEIHLHSWQTSTQNEQLPTRRTHTRMDDQKKDHIDPERPSQSNCPKKLQTHNLHTYDMENNNCTNKGRDLLLANYQKTWKVELTEGKSLAEAKIQRSIFQRDSQSELLFIIAMMSLDHILKKCTARYRQ